MGMIPKPLVTALMVCATMAPLTANAQTQRLPSVAQPGSSPTGSTGLIQGRPMAPSASPELIEAREFIARQNWVEAAERIEAALAKRPRDPQWRFLQGVLFAEIGKRNEAISTFELLTEDFPELSEPYNNLAALYVDQNELQKARLLLEGAIQNRPDYALAHENLADIYTRLAIQSYEKAAKANQPSPSVRLKLDYLINMPAIRATRILTNR